MVNTLISFISKIKHISQIGSLTLLLFSVTVTAAQIGVSIDKNPIAFNDAFQLSFTATESPDGDPDFSPLKQDFDIINQQKNSHLSWINGSSNKTIQWTLNVLAKRSGDIQIPAISFGNDASKPLVITVIETTPLTANSDNDELFLEVETSPTNTYVQAQVIYTVRLYQRVNIAQATLSEPELANTVVDKIGEDRQYNTKIKGVNYLVTERQYALFPQQSGSMTIAPLVLTAQIVNRNGHSPFDSFFNNPSSQTKRVLSKAVKLEVQAAPASFTADHWLPAERVELKQTWSNNDLQAKVGEPITRTVTIIAKGATSSQLPDIAEQRFDPQLKVYPDQAVINDQKNANGVIAVREQKTAFIPSIAGNFELPAIDIPWFNTLTQQMELAQLPAVTLFAITADKADSTINNTITATDIQLPQQLSTTNTSGQTPTTNRIWIGLALFFAIAWISTLFFLVKLRSSTNKPEIQIDHNANKLKDIIKELTRACKDNNAQTAQKWLIQWATVSHNITNLLELNNIADAALQAELRELNKALYAKENSSWDGSKLMQAITVMQSINTQSKNSDMPLAPLYPSQR